MMLSPLHILSLATNPKSGLSLDDRISQFFTTRYVGMEALMAEEIPFVVNAVERRQRHFSTGRYCARKALENLVDHQPAILMGQRNQPLWPLGTVGSISHSDALVGAIAASTKDFLGLGLDIEGINGVKPEMWPILFKEEEKLFLEEQDNCNFFATLLFSLKESFYKLQYPFTGIFLDFQDVAVTITENITRFTVNWPAPKPEFDVAAVNVKWFLSEGNIITTCLLKKPS